MLCDPDIVGTHFKCFLSFIWFVDGLSLILEMSNILQKIEHWTEYMSFQLSATSF